jgi:ribosomal-protein-alanine N-acetyltransferase
MREGLELVVRFAFEELRLHRLQAAIQPENERSIALVRAAGFRREGLARRYLKIGGRWRDHVRFAMLAEDWAKLRRRRP